MTMNSKTFHSIVSMGVRQLNLLARPDMVTERENQACNLLPATSRLEGFPVAIIAPATLLGEHTLAGRCILGNS